MTAQGERFVLFVGCLSSQQHASVSQGRICTDNFTERERGGGGGGCRQRDKQADKPAETDRHRNRDRKTDRLTDSEIETNAQRQN